MINFDYLFDDKKDDYKEILEEVRSGKAQLVDIREKMNGNGIVLNALSMFPSLSCQKESVLMY